MCNLRKKVIILLCKRSIYHDNMITLDSVQIYDSSCTWCWFYLTNTDGSKLFNSQDPDEFAPQHLVYFDDCLDFQYVTMNHFCLLSMYFEINQMAILSLCCLLVHPTAPWLNTDTNYRNNCRKQNMPVNYTVANIWLWWKKTKNRTSCVWILLKPWNLQ